MEQKVYTISELTRGIKGILEKNPNLASIWIKGEISNLTLHSSGHIYFTLKDENAVISAVFFKFANRNLGFKLEEGMSVLAFGGVTVFEKRGSYQFNVHQLRLEGIGELQKRIEQLRKKLMGEGIFDRSRKRPIPFLPARLGIVTSPTGAAVRDIIKVALRRCPNIEIIIGPALVQGAAAAESIAAAIRELNRPEWSIDVIIAGRGGGSFEDLMPFNEETVVRAFYNSRVPIISAVGHQIDHPLSDDAADLYAPTPSAAAEIAVPVKTELSGEIDYLVLRCRNSLYASMKSFRARVGNAVERRVFRSPIDLVSGRELLLGDVENRIVSHVREKIKQARAALFSMPDVKMLARGIIRAKDHRYRLALESIEKLSPVSVLKRGYTIAMDCAGGIIRRTADAAPGDLLRLVLYDGELRCTVDSRMKGGVFGKEKTAKD
ncbi:MAG: exodeoxyribonuclease VII large subunit [Spirochaetes bacterium]|jgi:exodeoxyribonuclease VII large subunit|nr:exodeoxyribonuclease VII large subunit [Spirochaetota bacterium]